jgi:outer membrane cobalamin receptor
MNPFVRFSSQVLALTAFSVPFALEAHAQGIFLPTIDVLAGSGDRATPPNAASEITITSEQINSQPYMRPGEVLEQAPGLIVTQHSGEGKANQYFLRGFNLDHGTDIAIFIDGMPVNMRTHGHGQGYADINFLIPELIQSMRVRKGPYFADEGDFASAGAVHIDYVDKLARNLSQVTVGSFGYKRGLVIGSQAMGAGNVLAALEATFATARVLRWTASHSQRWPSTTSGIRPTRLRSAQFHGSAASVRWTRPMAAYRAATACRHAGALQRTLQSRRSTAI